jgi:transposase-like protein
MNGDSAPFSGPLGGGSVNVEEYVDVLARHYLSAYLPAGGAAVKVVVAGDSGTAGRFADALATVAIEHRCLHVWLAAESTRLHMIDQIYLDVARRVDWDGLAAASVRAAYEEAAFPAPDSDLTVASVADHHDIDSRELYRSVRRQLEHRLLGDSSIAPEMRRAMLRLAQVHLGAGDVDAAEHDAVVAWLRGELRTITAVRGALIYSRIGRHNARSMLASLGRLLLSAGYGGMVVHLDYHRLAEARRPPFEQRSGIYYSRAAVLDAYETLRQIIDGIDELRGSLVIAVVPPVLMTDEARGLPAYSSLQLRVADEVRDHRRANPFAPLVRLEVRLEAVS